MTTTTDSVKPTKRKKPSYALYLKVKALCVERNMKVTDLGKRLGVAPNMGYLLKHHEPSVYRVQQIADFFDVSIDFLLGIDPKEIWEVELWTEAEQEQLRKFREFLLFNRRSSSTQD